MTEIDPEKFKKFIDDGEQYDCDCGVRITDIADLPRCYIARAVYEDAVAKGAQELKETIDQEILDDIVKKSEFIPAGRKWTLQDKFDIANLIDKGYTNLQIARMYEVSESSIKSTQR